MKRWLTASAVWLACLGMILPESALAASGPDAVQPLPSTVGTPTPPVSDVALQDGGILAGQVLDRQGVPLAGAPVVLRQNDVEVASTATDANGQFHVSGLRGGLYQVAVGQEVRVYRLWAARTAPPSAQPAALLVSGNEVVRGQCCGCNDSCCCGDDCSLAGFFTNPWVVAAVVATAIAPPPRPNQPSKPELAR